MITVGDMFCGAGGVTQGIVDSGVAKVKWAINHDPLAIESHSQNHEDVKHYTDDIVYKDISDLEEVDVLWASLECTNFSNAKGGKPRKADSRALANQLPRYALKCKPKYIIIENVREFMSWGDLDENGKPLSRDKGRLYMKWINDMAKIGYVNYEYRLLNSADYGERTRRVRYFGIFSLDEFPIIFPDPTHAKNPNLFIPNKWLPVKPVLKLEDEGNSIFGRKKPLAHSTLKRIAFGIKKYILEDKQFLIKYYKSGKNIADLNNPLPTITTKDRMSLITLDCFINKNYTGNHVANINDPLPAITTKDHNALITLKQFTTQHIHGALNANSIEDPINTIITKDLKQIISINTGEQIDQIETEKRQFFTMFFSNSTVMSIDEPIGSIVTNPKSALTTVEFLDNIICDIKMRFLTSDELLQASGFPKDYKLSGTETKKKYFVGNAVPPALPREIIKSVYKSYSSIINVKAAG